MRESSTVVRSVHEVDLIGYVIVGNSGSGKSTLAGHLAQALEATSIDLDGVYWEPDAPGVARPLEVAVADLRARIEGQSRWIAEGCYEELAERLLPRRPVLLWLDPGEDACIERCRARPWEPHKYPSREAQDRNLQMLIDWVRAHYQRDGSMSYRAHKHLYEDYRGPKMHLRRTDYVLEDILRPRPDAR